MNVTDVLQLLEAPKLVVASKIDTLTAQKNAIDAGSVGSAVFLSATAFLAANNNATAVAAIAKAQAACRPVARWG